MNLAEKSNIHARPFASLETAVRLKGKASRVLIAGPRARPEHGRSGADNVAYVKSRGTKPRLVPGGYIRDLREYNEVLD